MHSNRSIPSQIRVSQSSVDVYTAIPGDLLAMVWGSVSYGKKYSEGYPKIFVTAVQLYLGTSTVYGTTSSSRSSYYSIYSTGTTFRGARPIHLVEQDPIHSAAGGPYI